jgi:glutathionyl-hydroquinone reductase
MPLIVSGIAPSPLPNAGIDYYPVELRAEIDRINAFVYETINNGVYRAGFATTQQAYEEAFHALMLWKHSNTMSILRKFSPSPPFFSQ